MKWLSVSSMPLILLMIYFISFQLQSHTFKTSFVSQREKMSPCALHSKMWQLTVKMTQVKQPMQRNNICTCDQPPTQLRIIMCYYCYYSCVFTSLPSSLLRSLLHADVTQPIRQVMLSLMMGNMEQRLCRAGQCACAVPLCGPSPLGACLVFRDLFQQ